MKRCIVYGCQNHQGEGGFAGDLCMPCFIMITTGNDNPSDNFIHNLHRENRSLRVSVRQSEEMISLLKRQNKELKERQ